MKKLLFSGCLAMFLSTGLLADSVSSVKLYVDNDGWSDTMSVCAYGSDDLTGVTVAPAGQDYNVTLTSAQYDSSYFIVFCHDVVGTGIGDVVTTFGYTFNIDSDPTGYAAAAGLLVGIKQMSTSNDCNVGADKPEYEYDFNDLVTHPGTIVPSGGSTSLTWERPITFLGGGIQNCKVRVSFHETSTGNRPSLAGEDAQIDISLDAAEM